MSFSSDIKNALISDLPSEKCCRRALLNGISVARGNVDGDGVRISVDGENVLSLVISLFAELFGKAPVYSKRPYCKNSYEVNASTASLVSFLTRTDDASAINISDICKCTSCKTYFLQGIFLASGKVQRPDKSFFLELSPTDKRIDTVCSLMAKLDFDFRISSRKGQRYLYLKDGGAIADYFALIGHNDTTFIFLNSKIEKQVRSDTNRVRNCETNNIQKAIDAAAVQVSLINELIKNDKFSLLPDELKAVALARLEYSDLSLSQLSYKIVPHISRSGLNHRLAKITRYAKNILGK